MSEEAEESSSYGTENAITVSMTNRGSKGKEGRKRVFSIVISSRFCLALLVDRLDV